MHPILEQFPNSKFIRKAQGVFLEYFDGKYWLDERWTCKHCLEQRLSEDRPVKEAEERYCMGVYAGRYCDPCWDKSGYRKDAEYDYMDAGEYYWEDEY